MTQGGYADDHLIARGLYCHRYLTSRNGIGNGSRVLIAPRTLRSETLRVAFFAPILVPTGDF